MVLGFAVDQVLVDLVAKDPDAMLDSPAANRFDLFLAIHRTGWVRRRHEHERLGVLGPSFFELLDADLETGLGRRRQFDRRCACEADRLGVRGPVRSGQQHLVARVQQRSEGVIHRLLAAVGDNDLIGGDGVARVAHGLVGDGLAKRWLARCWRVLVARRILAGGDRSLDDVSRSWEVGFASTEADDRLPFGLQRLGFGADGEGGGRSNGANTARQFRSHAVSVSAFGSKSQRLTGFTPKCSPKPPTPVADFDGE